MAAVGERGFLSNHPGKQEEELDNSGENNLSQIRQSIIDEAITHEKNSIPDMIDLSDERSKSPFS